VWLFLGAWLGAYFANRMKGAHLRLAFGVFVTAIGIYLVQGAFRRLGWM